MSATCDCGEPAAAGSRDCEGCRRAMQGAEFRPRMRPCAGWRGVCGRDVEVQRGRRVDAIEDGLPVKVLVHDPDAPIRPLCEMCRGEMLAEMGDM